MRKFMTVFAMAALITTGAVAKDKKSDKQLFLEAYKEYQLVQKSGDQKLIMLAAKQAYQMGRKLFPENHANYANLALNYGEAAFDAGEKQDAREGLAAAEKSFGKINGEDSDERISVLKLLSRAQLDLHDDRRAIKTHKELVRSLRKRFGKNHFVEAKADLDFGTALLNEANTDASETYLKRAQQYFSRQGEDMRHYRAMADLWLGKFYLSNNRHTFAEKSLTASMDVLGTLQPKGQLTLSNHAYLIDLYEGTDRSDQATKHCLKVGQIIQQDSAENMLPVYRTEPEYPANAYKAGKEGSADVTFTVTAEGYITDIVIMDTDGSKHFGTAAHEAISQFRYAPRFEDGKAIATTGVTYRFEFDLD